MSTESLKRQREPPAASETRRALASRVSEHATPRFWLHVASPAGVAGTDAILIHIGRLITTALKSVAESSEVARAQLRYERAVLHAAVDARCDVLLESIDSAEATKSAALERELVAVDAALERWRDDSAAVREAVASLSDDDITAQHAVLFSRLGSMEAQLQALPTVVVEPPLMYLLAETASALSSIAEFGCIVSPRPIIAADLSLKNAPRCARVGDTLRLRLSLAPRLTALPTKELKVSVCALIEATRVCTTLEDFGMPEDTPIKSTITYDVVAGSLLVAIPVPVTLSSGALGLSVVVRVAEQCIEGFPLVLTVRRGIMAPLRWKVVAGSHDVKTGPCISPQGLAYCPPGEGLQVSVFDADGKPTQCLPISTLGLSNRTSWAVYVHGDQPSLLLADINGTCSCVVSIDPTTSAIRWRSTAGSIDRCSGIATLPSLGIVVVSCRDSLFALRLSDGGRVGYLAVPKMDWFLAADPSTGTVFGSVESKGDMGIVHSWSCCSDDSGGVRFMPGRPVGGQSSGVFRPVAVMPPAPGKLESQLLVGDSSSELLVLSLPGLVRLHTHRLKGMQVLGLAADPWGGALAVSDARSKETRVLPWPLPGMPPLT